VPVVWRRRADGGDPGRRRRPQALAVRFRVTTTLHRRSGRLGREGGSGRLGRGRGARGGEPPTAAVTGETAMGKKFGAGGATG
jgi:hypothetical protein